VTLTVITYKWEPNPGYRSKFTGEHVNTLARMIRRNTTLPHRFICFTDNRKGIDPALVEARELWTDHASLINPSLGLRGPSCYRRLKMFARDAAEWIGPRILHLDLDMVITANIDPLLNRPEEFVIWGDTAPPTPYNGSLCLFTAGCRPQLWEDFDPVETPKATRKLGYVGSDQAWIGACLGPDEAKFTKWGDGVYSYRNHLSRWGTTTLPPGARVVAFHGSVDPWSREAQNLQWVRRHYG
jgi:hypothetical protein